MSVSKSKSAAARTRTSSLKRMSRALRDFKLDQADMADPNFVGMGPDESDLDCWRREWRLALASLHGK